MKHCGTFVKQLQNIFSIVSTLFLNITTWKITVSKENFTRLSTTANLIPPTNFANLQFASSRESWKTFAARSRLCAFVSEALSSFLFEDVASTFQQHQSMPLVTVVCRFMAVSIVVKYCRRCADILVVTRRL